jgi:hypothetical protein
MRSLARTRISICCAWDAAAGPAAGSELGFGAWAPPAMMATLRRWLPLELIEAAACACHLAASAACACHLAASAALPRSIAC